MVALAELSPDCGPVFNPRVALVAANMSRAPDGVHVPAAGWLGRFVCVPRQAAVGATQFFLRMVFTAQARDVEGLRELAERTIEMEFPLVGFLVQRVRVLVADSALAQDEKLA